MKDRSFSESERDAIGVCLRPSNRSSQWISSEHKMRSWRRQNSATASSSWLSNTRAQGLCGLQKKNSLTLSSTPSIASHRSQRSPSGYRSLPRIDLEVWVPIEWRIDGRIRQNRLTLAGDARLAMSRPTTSPGNQTSQSGSTSIHSCAQHLDDGFNCLSPGRA